MVCTFIHMLNTLSQYTHRYLVQDSSKPNKDNHTLTRKTHTQVHVDKTTVEQVRSQRKSPTVGAVPFPLQGDDTNDNRLCRQQETYTPACTKWATTRIGPACNTAHYNLNNWVAHYNLNNLGVTLQAHNYLVTRGGGGQISTSLFE